LKSSWKYQILSLVAFAAVGTSHQVQAQTTTSLANGNSLTYNGLTYEISGCAYTLLNSVQSTCGPSGAELVASGSGRNVSIEVVDSSPSTPLLSISGTSGKSDMSFNLTVTASSAATQVNAVTDTLAGTGVSGFPSQVSAAVSSSRAPTFNLTTNLANLTDTASFAAFNPTAAAPLYLSIDLAVNNQAAQGGNQGAITLTSASIGVPEPASMALFGIALTGLAAVRHRLKRPAQRNAGAI
jgi:hypothetical protein